MKIIKNARKFDDIFNENIEPVEVSYSPGIYYYGPGGAGEGGGGSPGGPGGPGGSGPSGAGTGGGPGVSAGSADPGGQGMGHGGPAPGTGPGGSMGGGTGGSSGSGPGTQGGGASAGFGLSGNPGNIGGGQPAGGQADPTGADIGGMTGIGGLADAWGQPTPEPPALSNPEDNPNELGYDVGTLGHEHGVAPGTTPESEPQLGMQEALEAQSRANIIGYIMMTLAQLPVTPIGLNPVTSTVLNTIGYNLSQMDLETAANLSQSETSEVGDPEAGPGGDGSSESVADLVPVPEPTAGAEELPEVIDEVSPGENIGIPDEAAIRRYAMQQRQRQGFMESIYAGELEDLPIFFATPAGLETDFVQAASTY